MMMERSSSRGETSIPPGFRFHPTEEELVGYYLRKKVASQKIDLDVITDIDLYRIEPWDLQEKCRIGYEEQKEWYFFSHKDKKYPTGTRTNRATIAGFWKATGRDKAVYDKTKLIGMRKTLVFYKGRAPNGLKSDWIIHEYRLESEHNAPPQEEGWVVCRAFKKRPTTSSSGRHGKSKEAWDSSSCYFYDESSGLDPVDYITRHQQSFQPNNLLCKQELLLDSPKNLNNINIFTSSSNLQDPIFLQLPQLDSPSLSLPKTQSSKSLASFNDDEVNVVKGNGNNKNVTDWRDLDKFVAYQLCQRDEAVSSFDRVDHREEEDNDEDLGFLHLHDDRDDFLRSSNADFDIGICVFDK